MNWRKWVRPGLIVTVLVAILAVLVEHGAVERDLGGRVKARLAADGQDWAAVSVSGRNVVIRGTAPSPESQQLATRSAMQVAGVRAVANASALLPLASPFVWSAHRDGRSVALTGSVPSEGARALVLAAARRALPRAEIVDSMHLARGAPASFNAATTFALGRLAGLATGMVTLTDATLTVSGTAADSAAYAEARTAFATKVPASVKLGPVDILPARADPFVWSVSFDDHSVTLAGFVPNELVRQALIGSIKAALPGRPVVDNLAIASGEPSGFAEAATFAVSALERLDHGGVTLDGLTLDIAGLAKSVDDYEALLASLTTALPEGMHVVAADVSPAAVTQYGWRGEIGDGKVVLTGFVPSADRRAELSTLARSLFVGATIDDRVRVAAGEPRMDWIGAIKFAMGELAKLGRGTVVLGNKTYSIEGEAATPDSYAAIVAANAGTLPASLTLEKASVVPPAVSSYRFAAERRAGGLVVSGNVANEEARQAIMAAVDHDFGKIDITDNLVFASGAPTGFVDAATVAARALSRLAGGRVTIIDKTVTINGVAFYPSAVDDISESLRAGLPDGFSVVSDALMAGQQGQPVTAAHCRDLLQAVLKVGPIEFDGNKADIIADSYGVLDRVSAAMARCPDADVEIGAHSDSDGSASRNRDRTQARADAIVDFLVGAGVKRERLTAVGYGESAPIADNTTAAGKAANRRIEFTVELPEGG
jgi:OOP family OmpA-OmpF porin